MLPRRAALGLSSALLAAIALSASSCVLLAEIDYDLIRDETKDAGPDTGAPLECTADADCDDKNACTDDVCVAGQCTHAQSAEGTVCQAASPCNAAYACNAEGTCVASPIVVDDGDVCTNDVCDPQTGDITHEALGGGCISWVPLPEKDAPSPRQNHTVVWTGSRMIVWGGETTGAVPPLGDGASYDPATRTWKPITTDGAPTGRFGHRAVWTGSRMIVWGGYDAAGYAHGGGLYDPATDQWYPMTTVNEPKPRLLHTAVWTGSKMIVWGGLANSSVMGSGGVYDPFTNTWTATNQVSAPSYRFSHSATWIGGKMVVFGGYDFFDWFDDGAFLNDTGTTWLGKTPTQNAPGRRESHTAVSTGSELILWGGWNGGPYLDTGAIFRPNDGANGSFVATSTEGAPSPRAKHVALWTGSEMLVWGGCGGDVCSTIHGNGGRFTPSASGGTWLPVPEVPTLSPRQGAGAVWTGSRVIVWGGRDAQGTLGTGAEAAL